MDKLAEAFDWQNAMDMLAEAMDNPPTLSTDQTIDWQQATTLEALEALEAMDKPPTLSTGQAIDWQHATALLGTLEDNLSRDSVLQFAIVVLGKADVAYLTYEPVVEALGNLERRLNYTRAAHLGRCGIPQSTESHADAGNGVDKGTGAGAENEEATSDVEMMVTMARAMVEHSGQYVIQYGPDR